MNVRKRLTKYLAIFLETAMILAAAFSSYGQEAVDVNAASSLTMSYVINGAAVQGVKVHLYKVASVDMSCSFTMEPAFSGYAGADLNAIGSDAGKTGSAISALTAFISDHSVKETASVQSNADGSAAFSPLATGLYLIVTEKISRGSVTYTFQPSLISLPSRDDVNNAWNYDVSASPKYEKQSSGTPGGGGGSNPPGTVTVTTPDVPLGTVSTDTPVSMTDEQIPLGNIPKMGENTGYEIMLTAAGLFFLLIGILSAAAAKKKKRK